MIAVLLVLHLLVTLTLIGTVLIQRSEGGGLGIGSSQGMGSFMSGRGTANLLTRTTAILAAVFMLLSLALAVLNRGGAGRGRDILAVPQAAPRAGAPATALPGTRAPVLPARPPVAPAPIPGHDILATPPAATPAVPAVPAVQPPAASVPSGSAPPASSPTTPPVPGH